MTDADIHRIKFYCTEQIGVEFPDAMIDQTLREIADANRYHPVRTWLKSLVWDGKPRLDTWLKDHAGAEGPDEYLAAISRKMLVAMVKRVFEPGCREIDSGIHRRKARCAKICTFGIRVTIRHIECGGDLGYVIAFTLILLFVNRLVGLLFYFFDNRKSFLGILSCRS